MLRGGKRYFSPAADEERTGSSCSAAARDTSRRPLRRGRGGFGFVVGSRRVAGRRRAVLSVGPRRRTAVRKGSAYLRGLNTAGLMSTYNLTPSKSQPKPP